MSKIVVVGSLNMDLIAVTPRLPMPGETITGLSYLNEPGGKGANQAFAVAKLGGNVAMLGRVGSDDYGQRMRANLEAVHCDTRGVLTVSGSSGVALILVAQSSENSIVVIPGANYCYTPGDLEIDAEYFVGAQFLLLQLEIPLPTVSAAIKLAKQHGTQVILDPAPAPGFDDSIRLIIKDVDILTPNETEAVALTGRRASALSLDDARDVARQLRNYGAKTVVIKLGERGCMLAHADTTEHIAAPRVIAVDSTAAGDVFNAAFAVARSEGQSLSDACRFAARAASICVTRLGAQVSMPDRSEVESLSGSA